MTSITRTGTTNLTRIKDQVAVRGATHHRPRTHPIDKVTGVRVVRHNDIERLPITEELAEVQIRNQLCENVQQHPVDDHVGVAAVEKRTRLPRARTPNHNVTTTLAGLSPRHCVAHSPQIFAVEHLVRHRATQGEVVLTRPRPQLLTQHRTPSLGLRNTLRRAPHRRTEPSEGGVGQQLSRLDHHLDLIRPSPTEELLNHRQRTPRHQRPHTHLHQRHPTKHRQLHPNRTTLTNQPNRIPNTHTNNPPRIETDTEQTLVQFRHPAGTQQPVRPHRQLIVNSSDALTQHPAVPSTSKRRNDIVTRANRIDLIEPIQQLQLSAAANLTVGPDERKPVTNIKE